MYTLKHSQYECVYIYVFIHTHTFININMNTYLSHRNIWQIIDLLLKNFKNVNIYCKYV